jgi:hypothetical protein
LLHSHRNRQLNRIIGWFPRWVRNADVHLTRRTSDNLSAQRGFGQVDENAGGFVDCNCGYFGFALHFHRLLQVVVVIIVFSNQSNNIKRSIKQSNNQSNNRWIFSNLAIDHFYSGHDLVKHQPRLLATVHGDGVEFSFNLNHSALALVHVHSV